MQGQSEIPILSSVDLAYAAGSGYLSGLSVLSASNIWFKLTQVRDSVANIPQTNPQPPQNLIIQTLQNCINEDDNVSAVRLLGEWVYSLVQLTPPMNFMSFPQNPETDQYSIIQERFKIPLVAALVTFAAFSGKYDISHHDRNVIQRKLIEEFIRRYPDIMENFNPVFDIPAFSEFIKQILALPSQLSFQSP